MGMARVSRRDVNGAPVKRGDTVRYLGVSETYWADLPKSDQRAIAKRIGKPHVIQGFDAYGHVELEWNVNRYDSHSIWVPGSSLEKLANRPKRSAQRKPLR